MTTEATEPSAPWDQDPGLYQAPQVGIEDSPPLPELRMEDVLRVRPIRLPDDATPGNNFGRWAYGGQLTEIQGGIVAGAQAQPLFQPNPGRRYLYVQNLDTTEALWIRPGGRDKAAAVGVGIPVAIAPAANTGGVPFIMEGTAVSTDEWSVLATTTGHRFIAYEL